MTSEPQVYKADGGDWRCVDCSMYGGRDTFVAKACGEMLEHLKKHQELGEKLPEAEVNQLLREFWETTQHFHPGKRD